MDTELNEKFGDCVVGTAVYFREYEIMWNDFKIAALPLRLPLTMRHSPRSM